jgi:hypothetical protein
MQGKSLSTASPREKDAVRTPSENFGVYQNRGTPPIQTRDARQDPVPGSCAVMLDSDCRGRFQTCPFSVIEPREGLKPAPSRHRATIFAPLGFVRRFLRPTPTFADYRACHHDARTNMMRVPCKGTRHGSLGSGILILAVVLSGALLAPGEFLGDALGPASTPVTPQTRQEKTDATGITRSQRRVKYNACVRAGKHDCFKRMQAALDWCMKNPEQCRPLLEGGRTSVQAYGDQVGEKCTREQEQKCRQEWGL